MLASQIDAWRKWYPEELPARLEGLQLPPRKRVAFRWGGMSAVATCPMFSTDDSRRVRLAVAVPLPLLRFSSVKYVAEYLMQRLCFDPHPKQLSLRSSI